MRASQRSHFSCAIVDLSARCGRRQRTKSASSNRRRLAELEPLRFRCRCVFSRSDVSTSTTTDDWRHARACCCKVSRLPAAVGNLCSSPFSFAAELPLRLPTTSSAFSSPLSPPITRATVTLAVGAFLETTTRINTDACRLHRHPDSSAATTSGDNLRNRRDTRNAQTRLHTRTITFQAGR